MPRTMFAAAAASVMMFGTASAQGPGAADVGQYHSRFVLDSTPYDRVLESGIAAERRALSADPVFGETVIISRSPVVVSRSPAAIPGRTFRADPFVPAQGVLTPGAPLGSDPLTDQKTVSGQHR